MIETLAEKRCRFTTLIGKLIEFANGLGYGVALDQVKRTQLEADANKASGKGIANSLHLYGLAADINLYRGSMWLGTSADHFAARYLLGVACARCKVGRQVQQTGWEPLQPRT